MVDVGEMTGDGEMTGEGSLLCRRTRAARVQRVCVGKRERDGERRERGMRAEEKQHDCVDEKRARAHVSRYVFVMCVSDAHSMRRHEREKEIESERIDRGNVESRNDIGM